MKKSILIILLALAWLPLWAASPPADLSPLGVAQWVAAGGQIGSGAGPLPPAGSLGELFFDISTPTAPILYRSDGSVWRQVSGAGGGGVSTHSELLGLSFAESGHTDFASEAALLSLDASTSAAIASSAGDIQAHIASQIDPHGATMTVTQEIVVGSATPDTFISRVGSGTVGIASLVYLLPDLATPSSVATMTIWHDGNTGRLRFFNGSEWLFFVGSTTP